MLFEILTAVLAVLMPIMCYISFVKGYNMRAKEIHVQPIKMPEIKIKTREEKKQDKKDREAVEALKDLYREINNYSA